MAIENVALKDPYVRYIWVSRDNGILEVKIWFIYTFIFKGASARKIISFINAENKRFLFKKEISKEEAMTLSDLYPDLNTNNTVLPPRLLLLSENQINRLDTELSYNTDGFLFGDSIGGIAPNKSMEHNEYLKKNIELVNKILFNPGVLARIIINIDEEKKYIFQLARKNLKNKGQIFYKPIGGHLKFNNKYINKVIDEFELELIKRNEKQDSADVSLYIPSNMYNSFMDFFYKDLIEISRFKYFENPFISIKRELFEEIGPVFSSDGISLLNNNDLYFIYEDSRN